MVLMLIKLIITVYFFVNKFYSQISLIIEDEEFFLLRRTTDIFCGLLTRQQLTNSSWFNGHLDLPGSEAMIGTYSKHQRRTQVYARNHYSPFLVVQASFWQSLNIEYLSDWLCRKVLALEE